MRSLPPEARDWLRSHGVEGGEAVRRLPTATTAALFVIGELVLRWYPGGSFLEEEPDAVAREVAALSALQETPVPAPRLVAWSDQPAAVLMTRVPGRHALDARDPGAVRTVLEAIHTASPRRLRGWSYRGYHEGFDLRPPRWWRDSDLWERAVVKSANRRATGEVTVIHRDFHPGNVLWAMGRISGVVDWGNACLGPASFDLAHYRVNLAVLVGQDVTDRRFPGEPDWDVEAALGFIDPWEARARDNWTGPWDQVPGDVARARVEAFVALAVARLG